MNQTQLPFGWPEHSDWTPYLESYFRSDGFQTLNEFVQGQRQQHTVFPESADVFRAFELTPFADTKVVILGQDPYHGAGQAHGLSFSVQPGVKIPPSLRNIYKEMATDIGCQPPKHGDLRGWAKQGVLLLNTVLTVRESEANSHRKKGWEQFTDEVIRQLNRHDQKLVFILWGKPAEKKASLLDDRHGIVKSFHPSPLSASRGFFGSRPFSESNRMLAEFGRTHIDWDCL